jgi:hypothetical protein
MKLELVLKGKKKCDEDDLDTNLLSMHRPVRLGMNQNAIASLHATRILSTDWLSTASINSKKTSMKLSGFVLEPTESQFDAFLCT